MKELLPVLKKLLFLFFFFFVCLSAAIYILPKPQRVELDASGVKLVGTYYPVSKSGAPAVILLHMLGRNRGDWNELARYLQKEDIAVLSLDLRGHGESTNLRTLVWRLFSQDQFKQMIKDIALARDYLISQGHNEAKIGILGAYFGANLAAVYAEESGKIASLIMLSPGFEYKSVKLVEFKEYSRPIYLILSTEDKDFEEIAKFVKAHSNRSKVDIYNFSPRELYFSDNKLVIFKNIVQWFKDTLLN